MTQERVRIEEFWQEWLAANRLAETTRDWAPIADFYAEDATYGWMYTPDEHFMAVGREQIRQWALGTEMAGLEGWHYDYQATVIDEVAGMVIGFWKQRAGVEDDNGEEYEIAGIGGSWFGLGTGPDGGLRFAWQRDWFDLGSTAHTFLSLVADGKATEGLKERMAVDGKTQPGHYRRSDLPSTVWPPPVEAGEFRTQAVFPQGRA
jgi:ketosteroid isomerase-like protein